jgi:hypothetical protein
MSDLLNALANAAERGLVVTTKATKTDLGIGFTIAKYEGFKRTKWMKIVLTNVDLTNLKMEDELCEYIDRAVNTIA